MRGFLCKIWQFFLNVFTDIVNAIAQALAVIGTAVVDVLSQVAEAVGKTLGINGSTVMWIALGLGAYFLFGSSDDESPAKIQEVAVG